MNEEFEDVWEAADQGDPHSIFIMAKLCKAGAFGDSALNDCIYWYKAFFNTPQIQNLVACLGEKYSPEQNDRSDCVHDSADLDWENEMIYRNDIIEAGMVLGLYYRLSSKKDELFLARSCLVAALDASAWDDLEYMEFDGSNNSVLNAFGKVDDRIKELGFEVGETDE
jgi:hypothetical protein